MENPLVIGLIVFAVILVGAFVGWAIKERLPKHHLSDDTKSTVTVSMAVVALLGASARAPDFERQHCLQRARWRGDHPVRANPSA